MQRFSSAPGTAGGAHPPVERIHQLDGLRGVLALFVVVYHLLAAVPALDPWLRNSLPLLFEGWYAVDVFFVMSGFVMMHVYGKQFAQRLSWSQFSRFMLARVARLYPVHLFAMLVTLLLMAPALMAAAHSIFLSFSGRYSLGTFMSSLLMLQSPWVGYRSWNYPAWSISAEWHAYLLFPLLVPLLKRIAWRGAVLTMLAGVSVTLLVYLFANDQDQYPTNGMLVLLRVLPLFITGMALYMLWPHVRRVPDALALLAVAGTLACLWFSRWAPLAVLLVPLLVLATLRHPLLKTVFASAPLLWLGKISYSLYMTHALVEGFVLSMAMRFIGRHFGAAVAQNVALSGVALLAAIVSALVLGWMTWKWVEVPGRNFLIRQLARSEAKPAMAQAKI
jgi:peptidoglycan/LPS O-acetylase OafA/YrhL